MDTTLLVYLPLNGYKIAEDLSNKENLLTSPCEQFSTLVVYWASECLKGYKKHDF